MPLSPNNEFLRQQLEGMPLLNGRYSNIRLKNYNEHTDEKRGCFSMVFQAYDEVDQKYVALKFFDQDPSRRSDVYRIRSFQREHEILQQLLNVERCLQLASALEVCSLKVNLGGGLPYEVRAEFFAVEWIDDEVDSYFLAQGNYSPVERLRLFNEVLLAVEALHSHDVFHRDLKADNLRARSMALKRVVVAIDLGTAARFDSGGISPSYGHQVGAPGYAAPEAICGLSGNRGVAPYTDLYAIGCLLFELFNPDYFYLDLRKTNRNMDLRLNAMGADMAGISDPGIQISKWHACLSRHALGVAPVRIDGPGSSVPPGVAPILNEIVAALTHFDYRRRPFKRPWLKQRLWSAIRALENERNYQLRLGRIKEQRQRRREAILAKQARLEGAQRDGGVNANS